MAEENFLLSSAIIMGIGLLQGAILGRGIRNRFPSFKRHAKAVSLSLLTLFSINAIANIIKFTTPQKISMSDLIMPSTLEEGFSMIISLLGLNAGLGAVIVMFISITIILFLKFTDIHTIVKYFIFSLSVIVVTVALISRFTEFVPTTFQIIMYAFYQFGITLGIFLITSRKESNVLSEIK